MATAVGKGVMKKVCVRISFDSETAMRLLQKGSFATHAHRRDLLDFTRFVLVPPIWAAYPTKHPPCDEVLTRLCRYVP